MCVICPIVVGAAIGGAALIACIKKSWPKPSANFPPPPGEQPVPYIKQESPPSTNHGQT